jgi:hypothetical protein
VLLYLLIPACPPCLFCSAMQRHMHAFLRVAHCLSLSAAELHFVLRNPTHLRTSCFFPSDTSMHSTQRPSGLRRTPAFLLLLLLRAGPCCAEPAATEGGCNSCTRLGITRTPSIVVPAFSSCSCCCVGCCGSVTLYSCKNQGVYSVPVATRYQSGCLVSKLVCALAHVHHVQDINAVIQGVRCAD